MGDGEDVSENWKGGGGGGRECQRKSQCFAALKYEIAMKHILI